LLAGCLALLSRDFRAAVQPLRTEADACVNG
jgi:hypothetical protein